MTKAKEIVETIKAGLADGADEMTRRRGVNACNNLLAVLAAEPGQPMPLPNKVPVPVAATTPPSGVPMTPPHPDPSLFFDALIAKLRADLPEEEAPTERPERVELRIPFVPIPQQQKGQ